MKNNKKLVVLAGAAALGLVAATGVTSGFAWFAVNNTVTATSLTVKAKSNASYLLIGTANNATDKTASATTVDVGVAEANVPALYPAAFTTTEINETIGGNSVTVHANKWYTGTISQRNTATGTWTSLNEIAEVSDSQLKNTSYFAEFDFYLTLGAGSEDYSGTIGVQATFNSGTDAAVKAAILFDDEDQEILSKATDSTTATHDYATQTLTATTSIKVEVYLFIDGTSAHVYSDYATPITGDIDLQFKLGAYGA